jgi:alginate O-acetyltransferase complex protein AlgI
MQFFSIIFIILIVVSVAIYYLAPTKYRNIILLLYNYLFYSTFDYRMTVLLFSLTSINFLIGNKLQSAKNDKVKYYFVVAALVVNLTALWFFKYFNFFIDSLNDFAVILGLEIHLSTLNILLPLGISYYIFQTLTYIFDHYYETIKEKYTFLEYAAFASFFPTIVSGPIERASKLLPQIKQERKFVSSNIEEGFALITIGMFRKLIIADACGVLVDHVFAEPNYFLSGEVLIAIFLYAFQIYNDFAGYSSIARGVAKLFGFNIIENFKQPFFADSIADFWRRWHISLSFWMRDYLFYPMQFKFRSLGKWGNILAVMILFIVIGIWHNPSWSFVMWGFLQGLYISFSILTLNLRNSFIKSIKLSGKLLIGTRILITFLLTVFALFVERTHGIQDVYVMLSIIFDWSWSEIAVRFLLILLSTLSATLIIDLLEIKFKSEAFLMKFIPPVKYAVSIVIWLIIILYMLTAQKLPFIYAQF